MILVDTSVWADHLRAADKTMQSLLDAGKVYIHPMVIGELALGHLPRRSQTLVMLNHLPRVTAANAAEVLAFIEAQQLFGRGVGLVDVHLLAATAMATDTRLWARDRRLDSVASALGLAYAERLH